MFNKEEIKRQVLCGSSCWKVRKLFLVVDHIRQTAEKELRLRLPLKVCGAAFMWPQSSLAQEVLRFPSICLVIADLGGLNSSVK